MYLACICIHFPFFFASLLFSPKSAISINVVISKKVATLEWYGTYSHCPGAVNQQDPWQWTQIYTKYIYRGLMAVHGLKIRKPNVIQCPLTWRVRIALISHWYLANAIFLNTRGRSKQKNKLPNTAWILIAVVNKISKDCVMKIQVS